MASKAALPNRNRYPNIFDPPFQRRLTTRNSPLPRSFTFKISYPGRQSRTPSGASFMRKFVLPPDVERAIVERRGRVHPYDVFPAGKTALLVIDMQNFFMDPAEMLCVPGSA